MTWTTRPRFKTEKGLTGFTCGQGPDLVLIHGVGLRAESWNAVADVLESRFTVHALDMPGHGKSEGLEGHAMLADYTDALSAYFTRFDAPIFVAGHSMGALIAVDLAARYPQFVSKTAALNCIYKRTPVAAKAVQARAGYLTQNLHKPISTDVTLSRWFGGAPEGEYLTAARACDMWLKTTKIENYAAAYNVFAHSDGPNDEALNGLTQPTLFLTGENEPNSTPAMSEDLAKKVPRGTAKIIGDAAHMVIMTHALETTDSLTSFFERKD